MTVISAYLKLIYMETARIKRPTLLLDESKCRENIRKMAEKARSSGVIFRPHFKTHQSIEIGNWFREEGVTSITVSSVTMAKHFADHGWKDITIAFPVNVREADEIADLAESIDLNLLISNPDQAEILRADKRINAGYFIKIDSGYNRSGIEWNDRDQILRMLDVLSKNSRLRFRGFLTHSGNTYKARSKSDVIDIYNDTLTKLNSLRSVYQEKILLSTGDTPSCSIIEDFSGFDEIRPGNFVFYDLTQYLIGSCDFDRIAVAVACPVVEKNLKRHEIIIYGGGVHLSKDTIALTNGKIVFGKALLLNDRGWVPLSDQDFLRSLSQEHGIIEASDELFKNMNVGDLLAIIPVHSCMTADVLKSYLTLDDKVIDDFSPK
jgi:D-serine deaminase-like pyridoxal phosphate-dependent protein